jgi:energy-coupling factor transporter ATP-binding protein EcfA2
MTVMGGLLSQLAGSAAAVSTPGAHVSVASVVYQHPGAPAPLLNGVSLSLAPNQMGLIHGRSGAGKTTLLQLVAGLMQQDSGTISFAGPPSPGPLVAGACHAASTAGGVAGSAAGMHGLSAAQRMQHAGLVFQFPERHFVGRTLVDEVTLGWPSGPELLWQRQALSLRAGQVCVWR